jgi:hypothetical protein
MIIYESHKLYWITYGFTNLLSHLVVFQESSGHFSNALEEKMWFSDKYTFMFTQVVWLWEFKMLRFGRRYRTSAEFRSTKLLETFVTEGNSQSSLAKIPRMSFSELLSENTILFSYGNSRGFEKMILGRTVFATTIGLDVMMLTIITKSLNITFVNASALSIRSNGT